MSGWLALSAAAAAVVVALVAYISDRSFRTRDALAKLLERFESADFHVLMWRMEQVTRRDGEKPWSLERVDPDKLKTSIAGAQSDAKNRLLEQAFAQDWDSERAHMHELYFFALRVHAWLVWSRFSRARRARLLNDSFGYQLLSTLLDHRIVACRIKKEGQDDSYYPTQYGCVDHACRDLVSRLAEELQSRDPRKSPPEDIRHVLLKKREVTDERLRQLAQV